MEKNPRQLKSPLAGIRTGAREKSTSNEVKKEDPFPEEEIKFERKKNISIKISLIAILSAMGIGGSYALVFIPNVEVLTVTIFIASFIFGITIGCSMAAISGLIFHGLNPWGFAPPPTLLLLMVLYVLIAFIGGLLGRFEKKSPDEKLKYSGWTIYKFAIIGACLTLFFDFFSALSIIFFVQLTTFTPAVFITTYVMQIPFTIIHVVCNLLLFGFVAPSVIIRTRKFTMV